MTSTLTLITGNVNKAREFTDILGIDVALFKTDLVEIQSLDVAEVVRSKAAAAYNTVGSPVLVDDTGLNLHAWGEYPGALIKWVIKEVGAQGLLDMAATVTDRRTTVTTAIGYADANGIQVFVGSLDGTLTTEPRGSNGFGYDPIFQPKGEPLTYAEMDPAYKNEISHRRKAVDQLREVLADVFPDIEPACLADECDGWDRPADR
ncbi:non-canonical purine NTP pyrophosphatase [Saccharopolyspora elongata]|uniref:Non-canonical purine NTP pyrophosphatase n=1 Tax=Saccharopolyspora elongata TaxID=2530387 RepID=A0A4R4Y7B3_9PSEU|nr:non-canonical purine NTP pyrophosphatase [Saccharopolyspora elongata]TDD40308.1 non-canonical purine NTP pyrophosphatase [Saccharopolyspora elongata]